MAKEKRWTAYGKVLELNQGRMQPSNSSNNTLDIFEEVDNINMDDGTKGPYGIPISTGLAVQMIKNLLSAIGNKSNLSNFMDSNYEPSNPIDELLINILGITFDKSYLLKLLSQPKCEGIRFYPALKDKDSSSLTFVAVGVNSNGQDLNYEEYDFNSDVNVNQSCQSVIKDWGHPPSKSVRKGIYINKLKSEKYILLRIAESELKK